MTRPARRPHFPGLQAARRGLQAAGRGARALLHLRLHPEEERHQRLAVPLARREQPLLDQPQDAQSHLRVPLPRRAPRQVQRAPLARRVPPQNHPPERPLGLPRDDDAAERRRAGLAGHLHQSEAHQALPARQHQVPGEPLRLLEAQDRAASGRHQEQAVHRHVGLRRRRERVRRAGQAGSACSRRSSRAS